MDTAIKNMRVGMARGITQPRIVMLRVLPQLDTHIVDDPQASLFYEPIRNFPLDFDGATRRDLTAKYVTAIQDKIASDAPWVPLAHSELVVAGRAELQNVVLSPTGHPVYPLIQRREAP